MSYGGRELTVCPYILGHSLGEERAFVLAVDRASKPERRMLRTSAFEINSGPTSPILVRFSDVWIRSTWMRSVQSGVEC